VFSTIAEAAIDKNLDLPNDNIEIKTNWFICPDELVKNIEHASCGKYSTIIVTCNDYIKKIAYDKLYLIFININFRYKYNIYLWTNKSVGIY